MEKRGEGLGLVVAPLPSQTSLSLSVLRRDTQFALFLNLASYSLLPAERSMASSDGFADARLMREALLEAEIALAEGETPVGCVFAGPGGGVIARGHNVTSATCNVRGRAARWDDVCHFKSVCAGDRTRRACRTSKTRAGWI